MKFSSYLFLLYICFGIPLSSYGQIQPVDSLSKSPGFLHISTNYETVYVIIDRDFRTLKKVSPKELIQIQPGKRLVTIVPEFSPHFTFKRDVGLDSVLSLELTFAKILDQQPLLFKELENQGSDLTEFDWRENNPGKLIGSYFFSNESKEDFESSNIPDLEYNNASLEVTSNVDSLFVQVNSNIYRVKNGASIPLNPGHYFLTLSHPKAKEWSTTVLLEPGENREVSRNFKLKDTSVEILEDNIATRLHYNANLIVISDEDSRIFIDGEDMGMGAAKTLRDTGPVEIEIQNPVSGTFNYSPKIINGPASKALVIDGYTKPKYDKPEIYNFLPGYSQKAKKQYTKAKIVQGSLILSSALGLYTIISFRKQLVDYQRLRNDYLRIDWFYNGKNVELALELGEKLEVQHNQLLKKESQRNILLGITSLLYAYSILDSYFSKPKTGFWQKTDIDLHFNKERFSGQQTPSLSIKYAF